MQSQWGPNWLVPGPGAKTAPATKVPTIRHAPRGESWSPGLLHPNLSWSHYRTLLRVERISAGDNPTLGLILCTDKNDAVVRYTLGEEQRKIFASRYKLYLPTDAELKAEIKRKLLSLRRGGSGA